MEYRFKPNGVCSTEMIFNIENNTIKDLKIIVEKIYDFWIILINSFKHYIQEMKNEINNLTNIFPSLKKDIDNFTNFSSDIFSDLSSDLISDIFSDSDFSSEDYLFQNDTTLINEKGLELESLVKQIFKFFYLIQLLLFMKQTI